LLESELLGTEIGAFTGATKRIGKIEAAHGGTLFLDEIGDLPLSLQPKLLRFLQERVIERLGGREEITVDVRVLCATNQSLKNYIQENRFREDLYYRINEVVIHIPALRAREQDALLLARMFLNRFNTEMKRRLKGFSRSALELIESYSWPGNVRELENCIKRAVIMTDATCIRAEDLDIPINTRTKMPFNLRRVREQAEQEAIRRALQYMDGNVSKAADLLGVTRPTLYNLMDKLEMREKLHEEA
jgi:two-component system, NtrC family, response regulator